VEPFGLINARVDVVTGCHVVRREPAAHTIVLRVSVQAPGDGFVR
jgi:hypothetical protein